MNLKSYLSISQGSDLPTIERAERSCRIAKDLEKAGEYEAACAALAEFWPNHQGSPILSGLEGEARAELLLRAGALAGWLGGATQVEGSQESAKNLITQSIEIFGRLGLNYRAAEATGDLALCYWREGAYEEARLHLQNALTALRDVDLELRAVLIIRAGIVEVCAQRLSQAARLYKEAGSLIEQINDDGLKGSFHFESGLLFRRLAAPENREDYLDRALLEYTAASFHYDRAGNKRAVGRVETNLGYLFFTIGRHKDAHAHLDRARHIFLKLKDFGTAAQVDETRARTLLAQGHPTEAERIVRAAVRVLERGGQQAILAEAIATQGVALARLGHDSRARALFDRAIEIAETAGDLEGSGRVRLSIIEELGEKIPAKEMVTIYKAAIASLRNSQDPSTSKRLLSNAVLLFDALERLQPRDQAVIEQSWEGFSLKRHAKDGERVVIERALRDANGSVSKAAKLLGFRHHQSLISLLNGRHKDLLKMRSTARKRRKHLVMSPKANQKRTQTPNVKPVTAQISLLHVEDQPAVARLMGNLLTAEGWRVQLCTDGDTALRKLTSNEHYDLLIFDHNTSGVKGVELVERARKISSRRRTPIIVVSGDECEQSAWRAGANAFLRKPEAVEQLASTVRRLLKEPDRPGRNDAL
jgi:CheY-like chemotaxis protein/tetratricopeptide (TPR) repeat protein